MPENILKSFLSLKVSCFKIHKMKSLEVACVLSLTLISCGYESSETLEPSDEPARISKPGEITIPSRVGKLISNCQFSPQYNACIFKKNPIAQTGVVLRVGGHPSTFHQSMMNLQNYAVNITGQFGQYLQNSHYNITIDLKNAQGETYPRVQLNQENKWTTPYKTDWHPDEDVDYSVEQVITYHYLMYQREWMEKNAGHWFASDGRIIAVAVNDIDANPQWIRNAYWSSFENKIVLGTDCLSFDFASTSSSVCRGKVGVALSSEITLHEAGHANFSYSNHNRLGRGCQTHRSCKNTNQSLCDVVTNINETPQVCCQSEKGCLHAINEGQADFHASVIFPENPQIGEFFTANPQGLRTCPGGPLRNPKANKNTTAEDIFYACKGYGRGEIHVMGVLYSSIWWAIYNHPDTLKTDVLKLFTEHLPLLSYDDDFEQAGLRTISLAQQIFGNTPNSKGVKYARLVEQEFQKRGLLTDP